MYNFNSDDKIANVQPEDIAKLLRSMGATGNFRGFDYIVFIINKKLIYFRDWLNGLIAV